MEASPDGSMSRSRVAAGAVAEPPADAEFRADWEDGERVLIESSPGALQQVLLTTDGSVGRILEVYADEPIEVEKLEQRTIPSGDPEPALDLAAEDERLLRRVILRGGRTGRAFIYAEVVAALERLHPTVRSGLLETPAPIGKLLTTVRAETLREILTAGREPAGAVGAHFGIGEEEEVFTRTYRIVGGGRPIMLITEKFPTTWFLP